MLVICALEDQPDFLLCVVNGSLDAPAHDPPATELGWVHWEIKRQVALDIPRRERVKTRFSGHPLDELHTAYKETDSMPLHEARERARQLDAEFAARLAGMSFADTDALRRRALEAWTKIRKREGVEDRARKAREEWANALAKKAARK